MSKSNYNNLSEGSIFSVMLKFSLPFLLANLVQMAYSTVDIYFIGKFASVGAVSGVYQGVMINAVITYLFLGITTGGTILLGQYVGAKEKDKAAQALGNVIFICIASVIIVTVVLQFAGKWILTLMRVPPEAFDESWNYLQVCIYGLIFVMGYNVVSSVLRSLGDSKAPFFFILIASVMNIGLDYVFVGILQMAARGAALATDTSQAVSFILTLIYIKKKGLPFEFSLKYVIPKKEMAVNVLKVGIPISMQSTLNNLSFVIVGAIINSMGVYVSAATSVVGTITSFCMMIPMSLSSSISAITAQNIGAQKPDRAVRTLWYGILICLAVAIPFVLVFTFWPEAVVKILNDDPNVVIEAVRYMYPYSWDCIFVCLVFCFNGFFNGCGKTLFAMLQEGLSGLLVRIPVSLLMKMLVVNATIFHVGIGTPAASLASAIACLIYYRISFTKDKLKELSIR